MKHYIMITLSLVMIAFASTAWAEELTIDGTNSGGRDLVFTSSPSTDLHADTSATQFWIGAASTKTTTANGLDFAMVSTDGNLYQKEQDGNNEVDTTGAVGNNPLDLDYVVRGS